MKRNAIIAPLLALTAALATLPALGDLTFLKRDYNYLEKIPISKISSYTDKYTDTKNMVTGNLLDNNKDTEWISWRENIIWAEDYNQARYFSDFIVDGKNDVVENGWTVQGTNKTTSITGNNLLLLNNRGGIYRQYRIFEPRAEYPELQGELKAGTYKLRLRVKGDVAGNVYAFLGNYNANSPVHISFPVTTEWAEPEIVFEVKSGVNLTNAFCCVQPEGYAGTLEVDWAELSSSDYETVVYTKDYSSLGADAPFMGASINNGILVASANGWYQFDCTPDDLELKPNTTYKVTFNIRGEHNQTNVKVWIGSRRQIEGKDVGYVDSDDSLVDLPSYTTEFEDQTFQFTTNGNVVDFTTSPAAIRLQPARTSITDKIEIKSVKIEELGGGWTLRNEGNSTYGTDNPDHREIKTVTENGSENSIIYSYPLPTTRKVIAAVGNEANRNQQYDNKAGFALENNHIYTVSYKIRSDKAGTVTTLLANSDDLNNANQSGNVWNNPIGKSDAVELEPGVTKTVYTTIRTTEAANSGAVVLDLGYNLGSVEVTDLKVMDNYDSAITDHTEKDTLIGSQSGSISGNVEMTTQQVTVMNGLTLHNDETYTVTFIMKATKAGKLCMKLGNAYPDHSRRVLYQNFSGPGDNQTESGWQILKFEASAANNDKGTPLEYNNDGTLSLQLQSEAGDNEYDGTVTIQLVKITSSNWVDDKSLEVALNYANGDKYTGSTFSNSVYPKVEDGKLIFDEINGEPKFIVKDGLGDIDQAKTYKIYLKSKGTKNTQFRVLFGSNGANAVGFVGVAASSTDFIEKDAILDDTNGQYNTIAHNSALQLQTQGTQGRIEIESLRVAPNANEHVKWFTNGSGSASGILDYDNFQITNDGLILNFQAKAKNIIENFNLGLGMDYVAEFDINAAAGKYLLTVNNGEENQYIPIEITEKEIQDNSDSDGYLHKSVRLRSDLSGKSNLSITPMVYSNSMSVKNGKISQSTPTFNSGEKIGTDFFDVELGENYTLDGDGKYVFHIGYVANGTNKANATPKNIMIYGSNNGNDYKKLGTYEIGEGKNGNVFVSTVNNPLRNISGDMKYLRFYCLDNEGGETAICFPKENGIYNSDKAYIGSMLRLTRLGIYKQSTMFADDKEKYGYDLKDETYEKFDKWAIPVITRFQIEALGQQYAYPGATLTDMLGVRKDVEICGDLFDNDDHRYPRNTYWDTTLPFLKDTDLGTDKYQYLDYEKFQYPADDEGNTNYDCIDLLLPNLEKLGVVKKLNGKIDDNGYYQIVVSMKRSTGDVDIWNNRMTYQITKTEKYNAPVLNEDGTEKKNEDGTIVTEEKEREVIVSDETALFKNKANGFPIEISYQGFTIGDNYTKNIQKLDDTEKVITFPNVAAGDSIRFALKVNKDWNGVRIFCRENEGNLERRAGGIKYTKEYQNTDNLRIVYAKNNEVVPNTRIMRLSDIRAYVELNKFDLETKSGRESYDLLYNNREDFNTRKWKHTKGIIDDINNVNSIHDATTDRYMPIVNNENWEDVINKYKDFFEEEGIEYPDFSLLNNPFNDENVVPSNGMQRIKGSYDGQERQRSYTILHEVLALPGERVDLYPQSDIWQANGYNYQEQFVRWYDYLTDKAPDYLYFFAEPKSVIKTKDAGFIGGKTLLDHGLRGKGTVASVYFNTTDPNNDWSYDDNGTKRMKDQWVAADFSLAFNNKLQKRLGREDGQTGEEIQEPIVNFRHLFHITSGSLFADRYMATAEGNQHYAKSNRRYISTFADKTFRIRLEQAMPEEETTKSPFYYKTEEMDDKGNPVYKRVRGYDIYTYKLGDNQKSDDVIKDIKFTAGVNDEEALKDNAVGAKYRMFIMDDSSIFPHIDSYVETTTDASKWLRNSKRFARSIKCDENDAKKGRYLVRIYGKDENKRIIHLKNSDNEEVPLVIAEYEVEFLGEEYASFKSEAFLNTLSGEDVLTYGHHTEAYLDEHYGNGKSDYKAVNFDKYAILKSDNVIVDKGAAPVNFKQYGFFESKEWGQRAQRLKLPIAWGNSNYGFGYSDQGDYNMFRLADHSAITAYRTAADKKPESENPYDTEWKLSQGGVYDRLFYNTNGTEKGLFYYVNAAADPGDIVKIDFDYLCPGSTIYVSGWVNEFNEGQSETANVIFNFYANVAKDENGVKTILRQEQIHGFATGYVNKNKDGSYESGDATGGDQGKWMHVYYSFVPDMNHADVIQADGEYIDSYYLVLENNCLSSSGADYAIDDIRAYVVAPRVEARQSNVLCEKDDSKIDIQVELPLAALEQSVAGQANENGIVHLQYSLVDKVIYDEYLEDVKKQHEGEDPEYQFTSDDYYSAFAKGVLHYKHEHILSDEHKDANGNPNVEYPVSWGVIDFYMDYKDKADYYEITLNGETLKIKDYKAKYIQKIEGEDCFVFTTHPVSQTEDGKENYNEFIKTHRDYYVVVDNIGSTKVFSSLFYKYDEEGNLVKENEQPVFANGFSSDDLERKNSDLYPHKEPYNERLEVWTPYDKELAKAYQIGTDCARMSEFSLRSAAQIVVDGVLHETDDNITCCENQRPVVQINLKTKKKDDNTNKDDNTTEIPTLGVIDGEAASENPYLDWWNGPFEEFAEQTSEIIRNNENLLLWDILDDFRSDYPNADTWNVPTKEDGDPTGETDQDGNPIYPQKYTNAMRDYLKGLCATTKVDETTKETIPVEPKLVLHQSSYMFPQSKTILVDENGKKVKSKEIYVTAIPKSTPTMIEKDDIEYVICTQPREIKITVTNTSPTMFNGFLGITYPEVIEDVPLRIGLKQLDKIVADKSADGNDLYVPLRNINPATFDVTNFHAIEKNMDVYLVETNDPAYRQISDYTDPAEGETRGDYYNVDTRVVGKVKSISANFTRGTNGSVNLAENAAPMAQIGFFTETATGKDLSTGITFREGYYYKFRFHFEEGGSDMYNQPGFEEPCNGQTVFSIKVVPEYQEWTGKASLNYNNDENWTRVSKETLLANSDTPSSLSSGVTNGDRFTVNTNHPNTHSYAPLNFTKVIIPAGATYPQLAARLHSNSGVGTSDDIANGKEIAKYVWSYDNPKAVKTAGAGNDSSVVGETANTSYQPTLYIQYDMAYTTYDDNNNVYCRPWYANACEQIHFNSNAEILNQQYLDYRKAWVDMEMKPRRWYTVASPLYGVVAGDMYLPAKKEGNDIPGRQETELFTPIEYKQNLNDRFAPAVYQRGWDKGTETVYTVHNDVITETESVALASTWSHVYNDVTEVYAPGMGYSVKTDVTRLTNFMDDTVQEDTPSTQDDEANSTAMQSYVKFRFPKDDRNYNYFEDGNATPGESNHKILPRNKEGRLFEMSGTEQTVKLEKATDGKLFLVGNPFMAHLDMAKFLTANEGVIAQKFWILTEGEQITGVIDHTKEGSILANDVMTSGDLSSSVANTGLIAPMQGFFVQAKNAVRELSIKFKPEMMAVLNVPDAPDNYKPGHLLKAPAVRAVDEDIIRVTARDACGACSATNYATEESAAIIRLSANADKGYAASEDVEMIDDSNQRGIRRIYTVAGTMASAINQTPDADGVEVGLMAPTDSVTTVVFNGLALEDYLLYDTETGELTQLYDGFEMEMIGAVSGRYFLTAGIDTTEIEDNTIRIVPVGHEALVTAPAVCGEMTVRVFDTLGREVAKAEGIMQEVRIPLDPGIYTVEAVGSDAGRKSAKVQIR